VIVERPALERRVLASLEASRIPVLLGGCGTGRTSLLLRLAGLIEPGRAQYIDLAASATTPERCLAAVIGAMTADVRTAAPSCGVVAPSARAAFQALLGVWDEPVAASRAPRTFLLDEILELRTFENFPGLRHVQREAVDRLAASPNRFVLASRFTARAERLLRDAPARFEVVHVPPLDADEVRAIALVRDGRSPESTRAMAPLVIALTGGRVAYAVALVEALAASRSSDPVNALTALMAADGRLTAEARFSYEFRLHRARGYGALKAILGVLAEDESLTLTDIAQRLHRTPGSTKDYLSWLEDVDMLAVRRKRYSFEDPLLRLYVQLYGGAARPAPDAIRREVRAYADRHAPLTVAVTEPALAGAERPAEPGRTSGIIEID
jgi:hypothetical protein